MSKYKVGFIGCGNMGFALAKAAEKIIGGKEIILSAKEESEAELKAKELSASFGSAKEVSENAEFIFLAVKPQNLDEIAEELADVLKGRSDNFILVSMLAGVEMKKLSEKFGTDTKIIRIMPNTPVSVGEGMILMAVSDSVTKDEAEEFKHIMAKSGKIEELPEKLIDAGTAVSGCGPAYCFMFLDALADGAVSCGIPKDKALEMAIQTLIGSAKLAKESPLSPSELKDKVTSPGGSTIEGVKALEEGAFRATCMNAVVKAYEKTKKLGK
ncbi:MAG: pyrroline-5-carboxylate reductase [Clostridia bacterium]|nr:pyrroline-5-carboxylate reductase [Clostridia bacterium]